MKICIVGAGKRIHEMYGPTLSTIPNLEIAGFWNRDIEKGKLVENKFGWKKFQDLEKMVLECKPDALLIVVNSSANKHVVLRCIEFNIPIITETSIWDIEVAKKSQQNNLKIFVNEQTPFLPCEEFKMTLLNSGLFGTPTVVMNDCRTFEYHGISQLRRYIGFEKNPIQIVGSTTQGIPITYKDNNGNIQNHIETWDFGTITFETGQVGVYNFSSIGNRAQFRKPRSMRIYCTNGTICNDDNEFQVNRLTNDFSTQKILVQVDGEYMQTKSISAQIEDKVFIWRKEENLMHLNDQQIAVRHVTMKNIEAITSNNLNLGYSIFSAFLDVNILFAIRQSSQTKKFLT
jgi:predicted dehydrogenase